MADRLAVWLGPAQVGILARDRRGGFRFEPGDGADALTVAAAGADRPWGRAFSRDWFDNLLPEDARRTSAENAWGIERGDIFGLLEAIGWECAGAVSVLPEGRSPGTGRYLRLTDADVRARIEALPDLGDITGEPLRMSLGGVQEKLLLHRDAGGWTLPLDGAPSTHIVKPDPLRYPGLSTAEGWSLAAAAAATRTAAAQVTSIEGSAPVLFVERYDRVRVGDTVERVHQEDLCQALGLPPARKYATSTSPGEPSLARLADLLLRAADPSAEQRHLLAHATVNVALGNADAHAKNHSLLHSGGSISLAPLYDVVPTIAFAPSQQRAGLPVGGKPRIDEIGREHLLLEARTWGMPERVARATIDDALGRLRAGMDAADAAMGPLPDAVRSIVLAQFDRVAGSRW
jgi:serine/threonine-protein kinase HipA